MKSLWISLSLIFAAALLWGCAASGGEREGGGSGQSAQDKAILEKKVLGAYGVDGSDYIMQSGASMQLSRRYSGRTVEFSILDLDGKGIYSLSGIRKDAVKGDSLPLCAPAARPSNSPPPQRCLR